MKLKRKEKEDVAIDMSPMIDMVFLLLIFFIVASAIVDEKPQVDVPAAVFAKVPEDITGRFMVTVNNDGTLLAGLSGTAVTLEEIKEMLSEELAANPSVRVHIRADRKVRYEFNEQLMEACAEVGATDMIYAAYEE